VFPPLSAFPSESPSHVAVSYFLDRPGAGFHCFSSTIFLRPVFPHFGPPLASSSPLPPQRRQQPSLERGRREAQNPPCQFVPSAPRGPPSIVKLSNPFSGFRRLGVKSFFIGTGELLFPRSPAPGTYPPTALAAFAFFAGGRPPISPSDMVFTPLWIRNPSSFFFGPHNFFPHECRVLLIFLRVQARVFSVHRRVYS